MADEAERNYVFFLRRALKRFLVDYSELAPNNPTLADPTVQNLSTEAATSFRSILIQPSQLTTRLT
jgi:hypothetical protein